MSEQRFERLAPVADVPVNSMRGYTLGAREILVCHTREGALHALSNVCTHGFVHLSDGRLRGVRVICPLHGASFDCRSGQVLGAPATEPLATFALRIVDGWIEIESAAG